MYVHSVISRCHCRKYLHNDDGDVLEEMVTAGARQLALLTGRSESRKLFSETDVAQTVITGIVIDVTPYHKAVFDVDRSHFGNYNVKRQESNKGISMRKGQEARD